MGNKTPFIQTIKERCRVCYTCVRECPVKAIRITGGQAEVLPGHCIGCGNCVRVCRQGAKRYLRSIDGVLNILAGKETKIAIVAPSFVADFYDYDYKIFVGMLKALGFDYVNEVAFGADITAQKTMKLALENKKHTVIESSCPAVTEYIKCYQPEILENVAPIVSPMIATSRIVRHIHGQDSKVVFIGPCIAKKFEAISPEVLNELDEVLIFPELRELFILQNISPVNTVAMDFDPPYSRKGALFPLSRGMNQTVDVYEDLVDCEILTADGRQEFIEAIKALINGDVHTNLLELLCCNGCINGPGMSREESAFKKRYFISNYVSNVSSVRDIEEWEENFKKYENLDYSRKFFNNDQRIPDPSEETISKILRKMGKYKSNDELNCGACGYETCREHAIAVHKGLAEVEMCLPYSIERLHRAVKQLEETNVQLARTREALNQSEKLASMGQLAAGIAHELNNPLGVVLMYANLVLEEVDKKSQTFEDLTTISREAERCKKIVSDLLNFARKNKVQIATTDICDMVDQCIKVTSFPENIVLSVQHLVDDPLAEIDRDQMVQVLINLISNAVTAMPDGGTLTIRIYGDDISLSIDVEDSGVGINDQNMKKIFQPFFTTKQMGKGTGLGLAVTYGIVKMHRGNLNVKSNADPAKGPTGTTFTVVFPRKSQINENK